MIKKDDVLRVAKLARLQLTDIQIDKFSRQLNGVFDLFEKIDRLKLEGVAETSQVTGLENVLRDDKVVLDKSQDILRNVPYHKENLIVVPKIIVEKQ
jgi:aspartyl-tRNA(Asn)/glutamyl-tRNA(Gln) amidotransferase subunit C